MEWQQLPSKVNVAPQFLPTKVRKTLDRYMDTRMSADAAVSADMAAKARLADLLEADKRRPIDADFAELDAAKLAVERAALIVERAKHACSDAYDVHLASIGGEAIAITLDLIGKQVAKVNEGLPQVSADVGEVEELKRARDYLVKPHKRMSHGPWSDDERKALAPMPLPDGYRELRDALDGILNPAEPVAPRVATVYDPTRGRTMADVRREATADTPTQP